MISLTYDKIKSVYESKGYNFCDIGNFNLNIGFVRESNIFTDKLTDTMFIAYREVGIKRCVTFQATTKAGISPALLSPKVVSGLKGCAVVIPGQYRGAWQFVDTYFGWLQYPYFQQVKPISVWRDPDGDLEIDPGQSQTGLFGINIHRMSRIGIGTGRLGNFSEGCLGICEPDFKKALPIIREAVKAYGNIFTGTLLELKDVVL